MDQIERDLVNKFGEYPMESLDRFVLQTHLNFLADRYCQDRVKAGSVIFKIHFDEAIEQEYLVKDPTRKLRIPKNLRQKDKRVLDWEMLWSILAIASRRDRLLLAIDMTEALRPSELFALRWRSFDDPNTVKITETVYRRELRPYGKTSGSLTKVYLPDGLATELRAWKVDSGNVSPDDFIFPNADGGSCLSSTTATGVLKPIAEKLGIEKLNFQILRRTMATRAQNMGSGKDIQAHLRHARPNTTANE
jgi:integrase